MCCCSRTGFAVRVRLHQAWLPLSLLQGAPRILTPIRFELFSGSQLHIDMDDAWHNISHHRVSFKSYEKMLRDPASDAAFKSWPKPLTIEFLEEQYRRWMLDLTSFCWDTEEVTELGGAAGGGSVESDLKDDML